MPRLVEPDPSHRAALLDHLPKDLILARYAAAGGNELLSGRFASPRSSAALAANAFGFFADHPELLTLARPHLSAGSALSVHLETEMRFPWGGGRHPWLDVGIETADTLIAIEAKRFEPFLDSKKPSFSAAYDRPLWGDAMKPFEAMRDALRGGRTFRFLDAAQLVKHAFGVRTQAVKRGKRGVLCYLYAEPAVAPDGKSIKPRDIASHRQELAAFTSDVATAEVGFVSLSYRELLEHWASDPALAAHAAAFAARFAF